MIRTAVGAHKYTSLVEWAELLRGEHGVSCGRAPSSGAWTFTATRRLLERQRMTRAVQERRIVGSAK